MPPGSPPGVYTATPGRCNVRGVGRRPGRDTEVTMIQTATLRDGATQCRDALNQAAWTAQWADTEPKLRAARDALARELAVWLGASMDEDTEILHTAMHEALQLVLRALGAGIAADVRGEGGSPEVRRLVTEAIATLDEVL